jgi:hypothetical protein
MTYITTDVNTVFGIYDTVVLVEKAFDALAANGFPCRVPRFVLVLGSWDRFSASLFSAHSTFTF